ncbi:hypothetical protein FH972_018986 [Carpinus fangiana]|uniref:SHSP domain-containing protein n=1 Tax=Carpinus fangiana TaxID=176857 RepID=A0A5N6RNR1_9ROSI|nr:hypothetical protein FH972_018986 [Carpinus fangiana]
MANQLGGRLLSARRRIVEEFVPYSGWTEDAKAHHLLIDLPDFNKEDVRLQVNSPGQMTVSGERKVNEEIYVYFEQTFTVPENTVVDQIEGKFDGEFLYVTVPKQAVVEEEREHDLIVEEYVDHDHGMMSTAQENEHEKPTNYENEREKPTNYENERDQKPTNYGNEREKLTNYENERGKPTNYEDRLSSRDDRHQHGNIHGSHPSEERKGNSRHLGSPEEKIKNWENESINISLRMVVNMVNRNKGIVMTALLAFSLGVLVSRQFE